MRPLYGALRGKTGNAQVDWGEEMTAAFDSAKQALAEATMLSHPDPDAPIALTTDASDYAVGAVLEQLICHLTALSTSLKDDSWTDRLPWVLLGLRTAPKEDLQSSSAELVFGQALRVPGDFIPEPTTPWVVSSQRPALLNKANAFKPVPTSQHGLPRAWIPTDLSTAGYVFIRHNAHRSPLKPLYDDPFRVMETGDKTFILDVGGKHERITVDRLKPAHQALDQPVVPVTAPRRGRPQSTRPTRAAQVPSPDVAPQTTAATLPCTRAGREIKAPVKLTLPVFVNSGGACVGDTYT
ncbi:hypothetical protein AAFF_G00366700 [Aldrovandia affinis]|uniref:Reverse transcriptase/retrotransposon-derived protein RNase H-like domain-containing protein n=1 Tax=Aldrovandia affinis TaxID=143900 RepID=A0AAD7SHG0_9TELE|nr:hypothetical protein AAFF_G00366700 [Aldrovandia affinis]